MATSFEHHKKRIESYKASWTHLCRGKALWETGAGTLTSATHTPHHLPIWDGLLSTEVKIPRNGHSIFPFSHSRNAFSHQISMQFARSPYTSSLCHLSTWRPPCPTTVPTLSLSPSYLSRRPQASCTSLPSFPSIESAIAHCSQ